MKQTEYVDVPRKDGYSKRSDEQLNKWVNGQSIHNNIDEECCPDFSCCLPDVNTPIKIRKKFADAHYLDDEVTTMDMLMGFVSGAFQDEVKNKKVYISK